MRACCHQTVGIDRRFNLLHSVHVLVVEHRVFGGFISSPCRTFRKAGSASCWSTVRCSYSLTETYRYQLGSQKSGFVAGEHEHTIVGYSLVKGIGDGEPIASERFTVGGHEWVRLSSVLYFAL